MTDGVRGEFQVVIPGADRTDAPENIHTDAAAAQYGFRGAVVFAVAIYGEAVPYVVDALGEEWARSGWIDVRFRKPVYDGDRITITVEPANGHWSLSLARGEDDVVMAADLGLGTASWADAIIRPRRPIGNGIEFAQVPLVLENAPVGWDLPPLNLGVPDPNENSPSRAVPLRLGDRTVLSPSSVAGAASSYTRRVFRYEGPSLHTRSQVQHLSLAGFEEPLTVAGHLVAAYERKGHHYADYDIMVLGEDNREVAVVRHTVVFKLAARNGS